MANLSTYGATAILNGTAMPATLYMKLHIGNPSAAGTSNPASETTRKSFTRTTAVAGACENSNVMEWLAYPANETITHVSAWDAVSGGNCWMIDALNASQAVAITETVRFLAGYFDMSFAIWS